MVGTSQYKKGAENPDGLFARDMNLTYPAIDARAVSMAVEMAAKKMYGNDHVFMYNLTTAANHYQLPEKKAIRALLTEIGKKANANDILMIFFAGHGMMDKSQKQFYFLTADASRSSSCSSICSSSRALRSDRLP